MRSMTGYGKGEIKENGRHISVELKAVNHRFLDIAVKMARQFNFAEDFLRKSLQSAFARGHIDVYVFFEDKSADKLIFTADDAVIKSYLDIADYLKSAYNIENDLTASALMRFNGTVTEDKSEAEEAILFPLFNTALSQAICNLTKMREAEGFALKEDFKCKIAKIERVLEQIVERAPQIVAEYKEKLQARIKEALSEVELDEVRLINEIVFFADRISIDEEIIRMRSHIAQFYIIQNCNEPVGRKLDFLLQEMNREVNTMGSKSNDITITNAVIELKTELEKLREQIQNIE